MPSDIDGVRSLTADQRAAVHASFAASHKPAKGGNQLRLLWRAATNPVVMVMCAIKFCRDCGFFAVVYCEPYMDG